MKNPEQLTLRRILKAGLIAGAITAVIANGALELLQSITNSKFEQINHISVTVSSFLANMLGALMFYLLFKKTDRPNLFYAIVAFMVAILDSVIIALNPSLPKDLIYIADPLHFIVAFCSVFFIGFLIRKELKGSYIN